MSDSIDVFHVKGADGVTRSLDEHYDCQKAVEQDPHGAWLAIQNQAYRIKELEDERDEALNQLDSARHSVEVLEANVARLQWAMQELDTDPAITVAEHVQEYSRLAPFLPRSAAAIDVVDYSAALKGENQ